MFQKNVPTKIMVKYKWCQCIKMSANDNKAAKTGNKTVEKPYTYHDDGRYIEVKEN